MIRFMEERDYSEIYNLGELLHDNYRKLHDLSSIASDEFSYIIVYLDNDKVVGFLYFIKLYEVIDVVDIVVDSEYRRKGIGSMLMDYMLSEFVEVKLITLEVNVNNVSAIEFYKIFGFEIVSVRKGYYQGVDAYLMKRGV